MIIETILIININHTDVSKSLIALWYASAEFVNDDGKPNDDMLGYEKSGKQYAPRNEFDG